VLTGFAYLWVSIGIYIYIYRNLLEEKGGGQEETLVREREMARHIERRLTHSMQNIDMKCKYN